MINSHLANYLWSDSEGDHKIHLSNWPSVCMKKEYGGIGVHNLQDLNLCLIASWIKRYIFSEGSLWRKVIDLLNITLEDLMCFVVMIHIHPSFGKG